MKVRVHIFRLGVTLMASVGFLQAAEVYSRQLRWTDTMHATREALARERGPGSTVFEKAKQAWYRMKEDFPVQWDWTLQDSGEVSHRWLMPGASAPPEKELIAKVLAELGKAGTELRQEYDLLLKQNTGPNDRRWLDFYAAACEQRREQRLKTVLSEAPRIVFAKRRTIRPSFFAYTEGQSDAQNERHFLPGSELCLLEFEGLYGRVVPLVSDPAGAIRDPAVSWDASRVLFAWKKSLDDDDYHIYELNVASRAVRQLTFGTGFADYEPAWLPNGDIIFASTRCVQTVDCWWTEVSNLYTCDAEGRYLRRLGFDQVHTVYPQVMDDGRVIYTRWDYNDRGQIFPQPLFQMRPDGTGQSEFYGNNSWFPTTIAHARGVPGAEKVLAVLCGHHSTQAGKLAIIDPARGRQENSGVQLVAPVRETPAERIDSYGQEGSLWQYPYPLNDREFLTGFAPMGWDWPENRRGDADFGIYWMDVDGKRELLAADRRSPCSQPVPLVARKPPALAPSRVDYRQSRGTYYVQDVYAGEGLVGVTRGTIKRLRVVALGFRPAGVGHNGSAGPGGGALVSTPISIGNGSWDTKTVLGEATVHEDGSALFTVPARTPVYFQALDERGFTVQTMRSWSTLQPGEVLGCVGCHETKNAAPQPQVCLQVSASKPAVEHLAADETPRGFSFPRQVQPILDKHCVGCHNDRSPIQELLGSRPSRRPVLAARHPRAAQTAGQDETAFSLLPAENHDGVARRKWSDAYLVLTQATLDGSDETRGSFQGRPGGRVVNWISSQSVPEMLPPWSGGAARSELLPLLQNGHKGVKLSPEELRTIACWIDLLVPYCGDYTEANAWDENDRHKFQRYSDKRRAMEQTELENIRLLIESTSAAP